MGMCHIYNCHTVEELRNSIGPYALHCPAPSLEICLLNWKVDMRLKRRTGAEKTCSLLCAIAAHSQQQSPHSPANVDAAIVTRATPMAALAEN